MVSRVPLVIVLGATGVGKSKLAIELAKKFNGEVISADSMQEVEVGLGLMNPCQRVKLEAATAVTAAREATAAYEKAKKIHDNRSQGNKSVEESRARMSQLQICLDKLEEANRKLCTGLPLEADPHDVDSVARALIAMSPTEASRAWSEVSRWSEDIEATVRTIGEKQATRLSAYRLHHQLDILDPKMAASLHPNNTRKVLRSLEVLSQKGRPHSDILEEQRALEGGSPLGGPLRFTDSLIFWLKCDQEVLKKRLDKRVEEMMERGLVTELRQFHEKYNASRIDRGGGLYTEGIFQSIGLKEFHNYLMLGEDAKESEEGQRLLLEGSDSLKLVTRRYAKKQDKWITNRLVKSTWRQAPPVVCLDTTRPELWEDQVLGKAVAAVVNRDELRTTAVPFTASPPTTRHCDLCHRIFIGDLQWEAHIKSKKHKAMLKKKTKSNNLASS